MGRRTAIPPVGSLLGALPLIAVALLWSMENAYAVPPLVLMAVAGMLLVRAARRILTSRVPGLVLTPARRIVIPPVGAPIRVEPRSTPYSGKGAALRHEAKFSRGAAEPGWVTELADVPACPGPSPLRFLVTPAVGGLAGLLAGLGLAVAHANSEELEHWTRADTWTPDPNYEPLYEGDVDSASRHWHAYEIWFENVLDEPLGPLALMLTRAPRRIETVRARHDEARFEEALALGAPAPLREYLRDAIAPFAFREQALEAIRDLYYAEAERYVRETENPRTQAGVDAIVALLQHMGDENAPGVELVFEPPSDFDGEAIDEAVRRATGSRVMSIGPSFAAEKSRARELALAVRIARAFRDAFQGYLIVQFDHPSWDAYSPYRNTLSVFERQKADDRPLATGARLVVDCDVRATGETYGLVSQQGLPAEDRLLWIGVALDFEVRLETPGVPAYTVEVTAVPAPAFSVSSRPDSIDPMAVYDEMVDTAFLDLYERLMEEYGLLGLDESDREAAESSSDSGTAMGTFGELPPGTWCELRGARRTDGAGGSERADIAQRLEVSGEKGETVSVDVVVSVDGQEQEWGRLVFPAEAGLEAARFVQDFALLPRDDLELLEVEPEERRAGDQRFACQRYDFRLAGESGVSLRSVWISPEAPGFGVVHVRTEWRPEAGGGGSPTTCELSLWAAGQGTETHWRRSR